MEFLMAFDASADGQVTKKDFVDYYKVGDGIEV